MPFGVLGAGFGQMGSRKRRDTTVGGVIHLSANTIVENSAAGTAVGTLSVTGGSGSYTFTLTDSAGSRFAISTAALQAGATPTDFESATSHSITVQADNGVDTPLSQAFTIIVTDVDDTAPTITSTNTASVAEGATLSKALTANESVSWSLTGGADVARFELAGSNLRWASNGVKDYDAPDDANTDNAYVVQVTATDAALNATNQTITVTVTNVGEAPVNTVAPAVTGTEEVGETLTCSTGTWTGDATIVYTYQWSQALLDEFDAVLTDENGDPLGVEISGETANTYVLQAGDEDEWIFCTVTGTNGVGAASVDADAVGPITSSAAAQTWNSADYDTGHLAFSNGDKTVTADAVDTYHCVRSVATAAASQKVYIEFYNDNRAFQNIFGFALVTESLTDAPGTANFPPRSFGFRSNGGTFNEGGSGSDSVSVITPVDTGETMCLAYDTGGGTVWARRNNGAWLDLVGGSQDPATGTGGITVHDFAGPFTYAIGSVRGSGGVATLRMASADWVYSAPSGFTAIGE